MAVPLCRAVIRLSNEPQARFDPERTLKEKPPEGGLNCCRQYLEN